MMGSLVMKLLNFVKALQGYQARACLLLVVVLTGTTAVAGELTIYSSAEGDNLKNFASRFSKAHPEIKVTWVRDSAGSIQARAIAEKDSPRNDLFFGHTVTNLMALDAMNLLQPYRPVGVEKLNDKFRDQRDPPTWTGLWGFGTAICFNTVEAQKKNLPRPEKWSDLTDPVYKGQITMPNPSSSGTGFLNVSGWLQLMDKDKAWLFMDALHQNIASYSYSGSRPCEQAAAGDYVIGISLPLRGASLKSVGAPIDIIIPAEGIGWELQGVAITQTTKKLKDAQTFVDWAVTEAAMNAYAARAEVVAYPVKTPKAKNLPPELTSRLIKNDFAWASANQADIIKEWRARYDSKTEVKK